MKGNNDLQKVPIFLAWWLSSPCLDDDSRAAIVESKPVVRRLTTVRQLDVSFSAESTECVPLEIEVINIILLSCCPHGLSYRYENVWRPPVYDFDDPSIGVGMVILHFYSCGESLKGCDYEQYLDNQLTQLVELYCSDVLTECEAIAYYCGDAQFRNCEVMDSSTEMKDQIPGFVQQQLVPYAFRVKVGSIS